MKSWKSKKPVSSLAYEFGAMFLLGAVILICVISALVGTSSAVDETLVGWESKPVTINIQIDLEDEGGLQGLDNILSEVEQRNGRTTVFVTGEFASLHPEVVRGIEARGHEIGVHGWQSGEDLTLLTPDEQAGLIQSAFDAVRSAVDQLENVVDFKPQGYRFDADTIQTLQDFGARSISGLFPCGELDCQCWYAQSLGKITFPYPVTTEFWAVPISEIMIDPNDVPLDDAYFSSGAAYFDYAIQKYIQQTEAKDPLIIVIHPEITGADEAGMGALSAFLDYVKGNSAKISALDSICHFTAYITNFNATGPSEATVTETITIGVTYTSNVYCPHYRFRAYGKYSGQAWKFLDPHCEYVYNGPHSFNLQVTIPAPPGTENTYMIRAVGRGSFGSCALSDPDWPTYNSYEVHKDITVNVVEPVKIDKINVTGIPDANNPMTNDPSTAGPEQVQLEAEITQPQGFQVTKVAWSGDIVPGDGNPYKYLAGKGTHGNKGVTCTVTYVREATGATGTDTKSKEFELFFRKTGHEDGHRKPPNWYKYWSTSDDAACSYDRTTVTYRYGGGEYDGNDWGAFNGSVSNPVYTIYNRATMDGSPLNHAPAGISISQRGIDCVEVVLKHEREHREVEARWLPGGAWHTAYGPRTTGPGGNDRDNDELPNEVEDSIDGFDPCDAVSFPGFFYGGHDDEEVYNTRIAQGETGIHGSDWANPGKRSDPKYLRIITETGTSATLSNVYSDYGKDVNGNGLYESLLIEVGVNVESAGTYRIFGNLYDGAGNMLWAENSLFLDVGGQSVILSFDGLSIRQGRVDGPYYLGPLRLFGKDITDEREVAYTTSAYSYTDFERPLVEFTGSYSDYGTDTDGDGLYDNLRVEVGIEVAADGNYSIEGDLYDGQGDAIEIVFTSTYLTLGSQLVVLDFNGLLINQNGVDGPYYLRYLSLSGSPQVDFVLDAYTTSAYGSGDFETAELPQTGIAGTVTDYDGFPVLNAFVQVGGAEEDSTFTDANGQYVLVDLQLGGYTVAVTPDPYDNLMFASAGVSVSAGQIATVDFVLNAAGSIGGTVTDVNGNPVSNVHLYLSGYETPRFATNEQGEYIIPRLGAGTHTLNIDAPGWGPWYILIDGSYISGQKIYYSTSVTVNLSETTWVDFTQQPLPLPEPFAIFTDDQGWISGISYVDGEFRMLEGLADVGKDTWGVAVDYFNDDGHLDFVTGDGETSKLYIFLNDTTGRFTQEHIGTLPSSGWVMDMASADFNKDGNVDFVVSGYNENLQLYSGRGDGTFVDEGTIVTFEESSNPLGFVSSASSADYTVEYPAPNQPASAGEYADDPNATCCRTVTIQSVTPSLTAPGEVVIVRVYHYNSDGAGPNRLRGYIYVGGGWIEGTPCTYRDWARSGTYDYAFQIPSDALPGTYTIRFYCYEHGCPSTGSYEGYGDAQIMITATGIVLLGKDAGDFDKDGNVDIVVGTAFDGHVYLLRGNGDGTFCSPEFIADVGDQPYGVTAGDFDHDKKLDIIANDGENGYYYFIKGNGDGTFDPPVHILTTGDYGAVDCYDFDEDEKLDVLFTTYESRWILNYIGSFNPHPPTSPDSFELCPVEYPAPNQPASAGDANGACCTTVTIQSITPSVTSPGEVVTVSVYHRNTDYYDNRLRGYIYVGGSWIEGTPCTYRGVQAGTYDYAFQIPLDALPGTYTIRFYCYEHGCPSTGSYEGYGDAEIMITVAGFSWGAETTYKCMGIGVPPTNRPPVADAGPNQTVACAYNMEQGTQIALDGTSSSDPDGDPLTYTWTGPFDESPAHGATPTVTLSPGCPEDYVITLVVNEGTEDSNPDEVVVTVQDPVIAVTYDGDTLLSTAGNPTVDANLIVSLRDIGDNVLDIDNAKITCTLTAEGIGTIVAYAISQDGLAQMNIALETAIYEIQMTLDCSDIVSKAIIVIYNPEGGFATGGGWIVPETDGLNTYPNVRANFGFNAKYKQDDPTGHIEFRYTDGYIDLKSTSIEQLVITGGKIAQFKGWASVNGEAGHWFFVKAIDNGEPGTNDTFEIKIWNPGSNIDGDYDELAGGVLQGGNILVHAKNK